jgi:hypothetical protein
VKRREEGVLGGGGGDRVHHLVFPEGKTKRDKPL